MKASKVLIIDDEADIRQLLEISLGRIDVATCAASDVAGARAILVQESAQIGLCLTDMRMPDGSGLDVIAELQQNYPDIPVAVITAYGSMDLAIESLKAGAFDFVSKPIDLERLRNLVTSALKLSRKPASTPDSGEPRLRGRSPQIEQLRHRIRKVARSQAPVHIHGESGSGKELAARMIHELGSRADQPFVPVNCGAIPQELMESEFFGHRKGSFTGAVADKKGLFMAADGGTLFLDEVADLPTAMQVKLLRAIQEKAVRAVGSEQEEPVDVRILSATHRNLQKEVQEGRFRQDLYYRINVIDLPVPPLRERSEDVSELATLFLDRLAAEWEMDAPRLSSASLQALQHYPFPGNVRELENILERAVTLCDEDVIEPEHLQLPDLHEPAPAAGEETAPAAAKQPLDELLSNVEKSRILQALRETRWNRTAAAERLGVSFRSLRYRLKKLGLDQDGDDSKPAE